MPEELLDACAKTLRLTELQDSDGRSPQEILAGIREGSVDTEFESVYDYRIRTYLNLSGETVEEFWQRQAVLRWYEPLMYQTRHEGVAFTVALSSRERDNAAPEEPEPERPTKVERLELLAIHTGKNHANTFHQQGVITYSRMPAPTCHQHNPLQIQPGHLHSSKTHRTILSETINHMIIVYTSIAADPA